MKTAVTFNTKLCKAQFTFNDLLLLIRSPEVVKPYFATGVTVI